MILIKQIKASASSKNTNARSSVRTSVLRVRILLSANAVVVKRHFVNEKNLRKSARRVCPGTYDGVAVSVRKACCGFFG